MRMRSTAQVLMALLVLGVAAPDTMARRKKPRPPVELNEAGEKLAAGYAAEMDALKAELLAAIPELLPEKVAAYKQALEAEKQARADIVEVNKGFEKIKKGQGLVNHAKGKWIGGADNAIADAKKLLAKAKTPEEKAAAEKKLAEGKKSREEGLAALKERQALLDAALEDKPALEKRKAAAEKMLAGAEASIRKALAELGVGPLLTADTLDRKLAKYVVLKEASPRRLAGFAQTSAENEKVVRELLDSGDLLVQMCVADGAAGGNYGQAMEIYTAIGEASDKAANGTGTLQRLALAIALEHAKPIGQRNPKGAVDAPKTVDPVKRYLHYEKAFLAGELDPSFEHQSVWNMRMVVNGSEPDETLAWGREMLRNYRPDHITTDDYRWRYVALVRSDIKYGSGENKYDQPDLQFFQNILKNGGVCGRRAFIGRFILRAFGIPTTARPQRAHAALTHWTPDGWVVCLGGGWGAGWTKTPYDRDRDFLATTQARDTGESYLQVKRAHWIADVKGEPRTWGLIGTEPALWNGIALYTQRALIADSKAKTLAAVGEDIGEANITKEKIDIVTVQIDEADRKIRTKSSGQIVIPAAATTSPTKSSGKIIFMDSVLGGKQLHYSRNGGDQDFTYTFDAPVAGTYGMTIKLVTPSWKQKVKVSANGNAPVEFELPFTVGMWDTTEPIDVVLQKGKNVLTFSRKGVKQDVATKGFTFKEIALTPTGGRS